MERRRSNSSTKPSRFVRSTVIRAEARLRSIHENTSACDDERVIVRSAICPSSTPWADAKTLSSVEPNCRR